MKKIVFFDLIINFIKKMDLEDVEKIIYGLKKFSLLLNDNDEE